MLILLVCFLELFPEFSEDVLKVFGDVLKIKLVEFTMTGVLPIPLYKHQAQRLVRELTKIQVLANVIFIKQGSSST